MHSRTKNLQRPLAEEAPIQADPMLMLPGLFVFGVLIIMILAGRQVNSRVTWMIPVQAASRADYASDPFNLNFAPIDPDIIEDLPAPQDSGADYDSTDAANDFSPTLTPVFISSTPTGPLETVVSPIQEPIENLVDEVDSSLDEITSTLERPICTSLPLLCTNP